MLAKIFGKLLMLSMLFGLLALGGAAWALFAALGALALGAVLLALDLLAQALR